MAGQPHIACLWVPDFRLQVALRQLGGEPEGGLALVDPDDGRRIVVAASPLARLDGVRRGQWAVAATALAPELMVRDIDHRALARCAAELDAAVRGCCPTFESTAQGVIYASFLGLERRYAEDGPGAFLDDLRGAAVGLGLPARVGMAGNRFTARAAAIHEGRLAAYGALAIQVPVGEERAFLAPLPIELLPLGLESIDALHRLGVRTLGAFAALPLDGVARRFGREGVLCQRLAWGEDRAELVPTVEPRAFRAESHGDVGVGHVDALMALCEWPLRAVLGELDDAGLAATAMGWTLRLEGRGRLEQVSRCASPSLSFHLWRDLLVLAMQRLSLEAPVTGVVVWAVETVPRPFPQLALLGERGAGVAALERTLAQLEAEVGPERVGVPALVDSIAPEGGSALTADGPAGTLLHPKARDRALLADLLNVPDGRVDGAWAPAFRRVDPPQPVELRWSGTRLVGVQLGARKLAIRRCFGPWSIEGLWWRDEGPLRRTVFQVETEEGTAWIADHGPPRLWVLEGWMD